jgi:A/G-specific adenine glycosylase
VKTAAVDGNAARVLARIFLLAGGPEEPAVRRRLWALAEALLPEDRPGDLNQALMELGATACGRRPACHRCPVEGLCRARREGREAAIPPPRRRAAVRELVLACAVVEREGRWLLARRPSRGLLGGLWELPSAVLRAGEPAAPALRRALRQEHGIAARVGRPCGQVERLLTHRRLRLLAYRCTAKVGEEPGERLRFAAPAELWRLGSSTALRRLAEAVMADAAAPHRAPAPKSAGSRRAALGKRPAFH